MDGLAIPAVQKCGHVTCVFCSLFAGSKVGVREAQVLQAATMVFFLWSYVVPCV